MGWMNWRYLVGTDGTYQMNMRKKWVVLYRCVQAYVRAGLYACVQAKVRAGWQVSRRAPLLLVQCYGGVVSTVAVSVFLIQRLCNVNVGAAWSEGMHGVTRSRESKC